MFYQKLYNRDVCLPDFDEWLRKKYKLNFWQWESIPEKSITKKAIFDKFVDDCERMDIL